DTPTFTAIAVFDSPSAASSTIRARCARPARTEEDRVKRASSSRSPSRNPSAGAGRFAIPHRCSPATVNQLTTRSTSTPARLSKKPAHRREGEVTRLALHGVDGPGRLGRRTLGLGAISRRRLGWLRGLQLANGPRFALSSGG